MNKRVRMERCYLAVALGVFAILVVAIALVPPAVAYDRYSQNRDATNCRACHGDFRSSPYISLSDGQSWGDDLHDVHRRTMLNSDCDTCHFGSGRFPTYTYQSNGGTNLDPISCLGCHGRDDGTGTVTGTGLRQHHYRAGETVCVNCHADADPSAATPVGENILPPYYSSSDPNHPQIPSDPCNPAPGYPEDYAGSTQGLDNDGDSNYDETDTDCGASAGTPGEVSGALLSQLLVTAHDKVNGVLTISYGVACETTDNNIEYGPLDQVSTYTYSGQECAIGNTGTYNWTYPSSPTSFYFLVVGNNGSVEGSYGTDSGSAERPEDSTSAACPVPQDLSSRCD